MPILETAWRRFTGTSDNQWATLCRIVFAACIFFGWLQRLPWFSDVLGPAGLGGGDSAGVAPFPFELGADVGFLRTSTSSALVAAVLAATLVACVLLMAGRLLPVAGAVAVIGHMLLMGRAPMAHWGWAMMVGPYLLWTLLAGGARVRGHQGATHWKRVLQVHVCCMYATAGLDRLDNPEWLLGQTLWMAVSAEIFARTDIDPMPYAMLLKLGSWFALLLEPLAPVFLWFRGVVGRSLIFALIALHIGIEVLCDTGWWHYMSIAALFAFLPDRYAGAVLDAPGRLAARARAAVRRR